MTGRSVRLRQLLGGEQLAWLRERVRDAVASDRGLPTRVSLHAPTDAQRRAVATLLGRPPSTGEHLTVALEDVDAVVRRSGTCNDGLIAAVEELDGTILNLAARRAADRRRWSAAFAELDHVLDGRDAALTAWRAELERSGRLRPRFESPEEAAEALAGLARIIAALPARGEPVGVFASRVLGSAHALDDGKPLATLAIGAIAAMAQVPAAESDVSDASWKRVVWASVGLLRDELSARVLVLGLPATGRSSTARMLAAGFETGQPVVLTLRQLKCDEFDASPRSLSVFCTENPSVVAVAADRLGAACAPLVCTEGQPSAAALTLLRHLGSGRAHLRHHGDFDPAGAAIFRYISRHCSVDPWRYEAEDYVVALSGRRETSRAWPAALAVDTPWDPKLGELLQAHGVRVEEEDVLDALLTDLTARRG